MNHPTGKTQGVHHIGLTVPDVHHTHQFFHDVLGFTKVGERPEYPAVFVSDGHTMITLWQAQSPTTANAFNRHHNIGLHHLALATKHLEELYARLAERDDVGIEFAPEPLGNSPAYHMMCNIPGGIRLELIQA